MILRLLGGLFVLLLAVMCAILEVFYLPLRVGSILVPISVAAAVAGNVAFTRAMYVLSGSIWPALLPGALWLAVIARSSISRPEGDLLITDGGSSTGSALINLLFLLLGSLALAFAVGTLRRGKQTGRTPAAPSSVETSPVTPVTPGTPVIAGQPPDTAGRR